MLKSLKQRFSRIDGLFILTVVVPTALAVIYFGFMASDVYVSESRIVVRSPERPTVASSSGIGSLLQGVGFARASEDSYSVQDYVMSRDALKALNERIGLDRKYADPKVDPISRFSGIDPDNSFEALHEYYKKMVKVQTDSASSISTVTVRAFSAKDAYEANRILLEKSEELVNRLNERGRGDLLRYAQAEVATAAAKAKEAAVQLSAYRNSKSVLDPEKQAGVQMQQVAKLQDELIATSVQLAQLRTSTPGNSQIPALVSRARTLRDEIAKETAKATGGQQSLADKFADYQRLALDAEFANKQLGSALTSLEMARNEVQRQQVYLERIAQPSLADVAQEPHRVRSIIATLLLGLIAWGILSMLVAGVREHKG
jgi:capsular polysaccharide transport system permease protein